MSDPTEIYLQPECCADDGVGRIWCEHDAPVDCEDGVPWTKYVLAARVRELEAERYLLLNLYEAAKQLADNAEEYDCDGLGLFAQHGWWEPLHEALEALNDDSTT